MCPWMLLASLLVFFAAIGVDMHDNATAYDAFSSMNNVPHMSLCCRART